MEDQDLRNFRFFYFRPSFKKFNTNCPFLAIVISENENIMVKHLKEMLLKSLETNAKIDEEQSRSISISRIASEDKHYHLLLDDFSINGIKAMNKFVYIFETSLNNSKYNCSVCRNSKAQELKWHRDSNCCVTFCDTCSNVYTVNDIIFDCYGCKKEALVTSFESVGKQASISCLNIPASLYCNFSDNVEKELSGLIRLTNDDKLLQEKSSVHFCFDKEPFKPPYFYKIECVFESKSKEPISLESDLNTINVDDKNTSPEVQEEKPNSRIEISEICKGDETVLRDKIEKPQKDTLEQPVILENGLNIINVDDKNTSPEVEEEKQNSRIKISQICKEDETVLREKIEKHQKDILERPVNLENGLNKINVDNNNSSLEVQEGKLISQTNLDFLISLISKDNGTIVEEKLEKLRKDTLEVFKEESQTLKNRLENIMQEFGKMSESQKISSERNFKPFEKLKFSGRMDFKHPVRFIEDFEFFAKQEKLSDFEKQYFFGQTLTKEAADWLDTYGYGKTFKGMRESFLEFFWNVDDQDYFNNFLKHGKYNKSSEMSMFAYFHKCAYEANFLNNVPDEELLTKYLCQHFNTFVQAKLYENNVKTIKEALQILKNLENSVVNEDSELEIQKNIFSNFLNVKKSKLDVWMDCFGYKYDVIKKNNQVFYRCLTAKIWPMHTLDVNTSMTNIKHFDVTCDELSSHFLSNVPEELHSVSLDIKGKREDYTVLGPITVCKQTEKQLIVSTCPSFRSHSKLMAGQIMHFNTEEFFGPCGVVTCSIPEDFEFRYVIPNNKEQLVCLLCKEKIEQVEFCAFRTVAVQDLIVRYFEQKFFKKKHVLRFLNEKFCTVYTVWDTATELYNPLKPTYH